MLRQIQTTADSIHLALSKMQKDDKNNFYSWFGNLAGACAIGAAATYKSLKQKGFDPVIVIGIGHCWVEIDNIIIDPTATQFGFNDGEIDRAYVCEKIDENDWQRIYDYGTAYIRGKWGQIHLNKEFKGWDANTKPDQFNVYRVFDYLTN